MVVAVRHQGGFLGGGGGLCILYGGLRHGSGLHGGRLRLGWAGTHGVIRVHELLRAVRRGKHRGVQLHRKAGGRLAGLDGLGRLLTGQDQRLPYRALRRRRLRGRRGAALLAGGKFHGAALFAVDGAGRAGLLYGGLLLLILLLVDDAAQHHQGIARQRFADQRIAGMLGLRAGVLAAPEARAGLLRGARGGRQRGQRRLILPFLGDHQLVGGIGVAVITAEQAVEKAVLAGRPRGRGLCGLGFVREKFLRLDGLRGRMRGGLTAVAAAQRDIDRLEMVGVVGRFQAEETALFLAGVAQAALFIGHNSDGICEEALEIRLALVQRAGVRDIAVRGHLAQKILDDAGAGSVLQRGVALHGGGGLPDRLHRLRGLGRLLDLRRALLHRRGGRGHSRAQRCFRRAAGRGRGRSGGRCAHQFFKIVRAAKIGERDLAVLGRRALQRRGGNAHAAQNFIDLMIGDAGAHAVCGLALVQIRQDAVYRIIGTFAWHFYAPFILYKVEIQLITSWRCGGAARRSTGYRRLR